MISARNTTLAGNNCDLHDMAAAPVLKPTIVDGNWTTTPAVLIDGMDKRVVRAALLTGQLSVSDLMEPEEAAECRFVMT